MTGPLPDHLILPQLRNLPGYVPGKPIEEVAREYGLDPASIVKLASNENPLGMGPMAREAVLQAMAEAERYPDGHGHALRQALVERLHVAPEQIVLGNGSSDLIVMAATALLGPRTSAVVSQYAFSAYTPAVKIQDAVLRVVPAAGFGHDLQAMLAAISEDTRLVFVANPNNPTGTVLPPDELLSFLQQVPPQVVVVLDEAYREFQAPGSRVESVDWITRFPNLLVLRTLSKAYGLAGLRLGYAVGSVQVAGLLNKVRQMFNTSLLAQAAGVAALADQDFLQRTYEVNRAGLAQLYHGLEHLGLDYVPSAGNFVMVRVPGAGEVFVALLRRGVIVRPLRPNYGLDDYLRVSVGLEAENARFLSELGAVLAARGSRQAAPAA